MITGLRTVTVTHERYRAGYGDLGTLDGRPYQLSELAYRLWSMLAGRVPTMVAQGTIGVAGSASAPATAAARETGRRVSLPLTQFDR